VEEGEGKLEERQKGREKVGKRCRILNHALSLSEKMPEDGYLGSTYGNSTANTNWTPA
jgi:hypothetical protein